MLIRAQQRSIVIAVRTVILRLKFASLSPVVWCGWRYDSRFDEHWYLSLASAVLACWDGGASLLRVPASWLMALDWWAWVVWAKDITLSQSEVVEGALGQAFGFCYKKRLKAEHESKIVLFLCYNFKDPLFDRALTLVERWLWRCCFAMSVWLVFLLA